MQLSSFCGDTRPVTRKFTAAVKLGEEERQLPLFVVKGQCPTLFSRSRMKEFQLGILKPESIFSMSYAEAVDHFQEVFSEGLGTFHEVKARIMVPQDAKPRFFKPQQSPLL